MAERYRLLAIWHEQLTAAYTKMYDIHHIVSYRIVSEYYPVATSRVVR